MCFFDLIQRFPKVQQNCQFYDIKVDFNANKKEALFVQTKPLISLKLSILTGSQDKFNPSIQCFTLQGIIVGYRTYFTISHIG